MPKSKNMINQVAKILQAIAPMQQNFVKHGDTLKHLKKQKQTLQGSDYKLVSTNPKKQI